MQKHRRLLLCLFFSSCIITALAQQPSAQPATIAVSSKLPAVIGQKVNSLDNRFTRQNEKYLKRLQKQEEKIFRKLLKHDSTAISAFGNPKEKYKQLAQQLNNANSKADKLLRGKYLPGLDSLATSLGFLKDAKNIVSKSKDIQAQLGNSLDKLQGLQAKLNEARNIQQLIQERQQQLKQLLSNYSNIKGLNKYLGKYQQDAFYYGQQLNELKESFNEPDKLVAKTLALLQKVPAFQKFWQRNSMIAAMFPMPDNYGTPAALTGLQTRANVQQVLGQQLQLPVSTSITSRERALTIDIDK